MDNEFKFRGNNLDGPASFIRNKLLELYPDKKVKLNDLASVVRKELYPNEPPDKGLQKAYQRISVDFKASICIRKWGKKDNMQLVKLNGPNNWVYIGWIPVGEVT
jgi:hypothetical protein